MLATMKGLLCKSLIHERLPLTDDLKVRSEQNVGVRARYCCSKLASRLDTHSRAEGHVCLELRGFRWRRR